MTEMQYQTYFSKLLGCYIGKTIGGTLGMPYEGNTNVNHITYYDPIPTSVVGNDDVDLQVVWVECLRRHGLPVNRKHLADAWRHVRFAPDEYGIMLNNTFQNGLSAPLCGFYNNKFYAGMGAAIRSELWASLAPGDPKLAVSLAREDACTDHYGDGMDACLFLTAIESAAYVEDDFDKLIQIGLSFLPAQSRFARSIMDTLRWWKEEGDCYAVRDKILEKYGVDNWTDVCINVSFTVLAWAAGSGDFGKSVCLAVNMGYDADCTAATLGSILGIINPDGIDEKWTKPIGNRLILSPNIVGMHTVKTVAEFCDQITALAVEVQEYYNSSIRIIGCPPLENARKNMAKPWMNKPELVGLKEGYDNRESLLSLSPLLINLRYPESVALLPNLWNAFEAEITNPSDVLTKVHLHLCVPDGFHLSEDRFSMELHPSEKKKIRFDIRYDSGNEKKSFNSLDFRMQVNGLIFNVTAGLPTAYPWIRKKGKYSSKLCPALDLKEDFEFAPSNAFFQTVPPGEYIYAIDVKADVTRNAVIVCQGTREMKIWMNGEFLYTFDQGQFYYCDWDMWWTDDSQALKNSVLRAISGGPIYISDALNRSNADILRPLVFEDGRILRCDRLAVPAKDCLTVDPLTSGRIFKLQNMCNNCGIVAAFNLSEENKPVEGSISKTDVEGLEGDEFAVYEHFSKEVRIIKSGESIEVRLADNDDFKLYIIVPLINGSGVIGRIDKFISPKTVKYNRKGEAELIEDGPCAYIKNRKLVIEN